MIARLAPALTCLGAWLLIGCSGGSTSEGMLRDEDGDGFPALIVINPTSGARGADLVLPADWELSPAAEFADVFGAPVHRDGQRVRVEVPARSAALLLSETKCMGESR